MNRHGPYYMLPLWSLLFLWPVYLLAGLLKLVLLPFKFVGWLLRPRHRQGRGGW